MYGNTERNYAVRIMLLASAGNPHRRKNINAQEFDDLINAYHNWDRHSISDSRILNEEAEALSNCIRTWESNNEKIVRNWSLRLKLPFDKSPQPMLTQGSVHFSTRLYWVHIRGTPSKSNAFSWRGVG